MKTIIIEDKLPLHLRHVLIQMVVYCSKNLHMRNVEISRMFRRDRADIKRMLDGNKKKRTK